MFYTPYGFYKRSWNTVSPPSLTNSLKLNTLNKFTSAVKRARGSSTTSTDSKYPTRAPGPGNTATKSGENDHNAGLSGGAIAGIVLAPIAVVIIMLSST